MMKEGEIMKLDFIDDYRDELIAIRRDIHRYPEQGWCEFRRETDELNKDMYDSAVSIIDGIAKTYGVRYEIMPAGASISAESSKELESKDNGGLAPHLPLDNFPISSCI
jgi:metal-dependent amidase/aminoacylase/carboxypeptidase family protein